MGNAVPRRGSICNQRGEVIHYFCLKPIANAVFLSALAAIYFSCNICLVPYRIFHLHSCCIELFNRVMKKQQNVMLAFYHFFFTFYHMA